jgi:hypothetical protein
MQQIRLTMSQGIPLLPNNFPSRLLRAHGRRCPWPRAAVEDRPALLCYSQILVGKSRKAPHATARMIIEARCARWLLSTHDRVAGKRIPSYSRISRDDAQECPWRSIKLQQDGLVQTRGEIYEQLAVGIAHLPLLLNSAASSVFRAASCSPSVFQIEVGLFRFREKFLFLSLDVVLKLLAQDLYFRIEQLVADAHPFNFGNELLGRRVFDSRLVEQIVIAGGLACCRVEDFSLRFARGP